jgi:hypothetical protein
MGTGVGEAMLIGAAVGATAGGAGAAIQGGDPLKGALLGGAMGGIGGGVSGALAPATAALPSAAATPAMTGVAGLGGSTGAGITAALPTAATPAMVGTAGLGGSAGSGLTSALTPATTSSIFGGAGQGVGTATSLGQSIAGGGGGYGAFSAGAAPVSNMSPIFSGLETAGAGGASAAVSPTVQASGVSTNPSLMDMFRAVPKPSLTQDSNSQTAAKNVFGQTLGQPGVLSNKTLGMTAAGGTLAGMSTAGPSLRGILPEEEYDGPLSKLKYDPDKFSPSNPIYAPNSVYRPTYAAEGGIMRLVDGGMASSGNYGYPMNKNPDTTPNLEVAYGMAEGGIARYAPGGMVDLPAGIDVIPQLPPQDAGIEAFLNKKKRMMTPEQMGAVTMQGMSKEALNDIYGEMSAKNLAGGGHLGGYSDGGRMLKGPGDGMSDSIPGVIAGKQPARLADGEFVIPADVVSHLGNGSTDAGAKQLYSMMDRVRKARTGKKAQGKQIKPAKYMVA